MDVVLDEVDKEVTKVKKLVMEVNEDLVLVFIHCDCQRGYHKVVLEWSGTEQGGWRGGQPGGWQGGGQRCQRVGGLEVLVIFGESAD